MKNKNKYIYGLSLLFVFLNNSYAVEATSTLDVQVEVKPFCEINVNPEMNFGVVSMIANTVATNNITVRCTKTTPYEIEIAPGASSSSDINRSLLHTDGVSKLSYNIYQTWNGTTGKLWGITDSSNAKSGNATGVVETHTMTGVITKEQASANAGEYSESVRVLVKY